MGTCAHFYYVLDNLYIYIYFHLVRRSFFVQPKIYRFCVFCTLFLSLSPSIRLNCLRLFFFLALSSLLVFTATRARCACESNIAISIYTGRLIFIKTNNFVFLLLLNTSGIEVISTRLQYGFQQEYGHAKCVQSYVGVCTNRANTQLSTNVVWTLINKRIL